MFRRKIIRRIARSFIALFILLNLIAAMHAWRFTHTSITAKTKTKEPDQLSISTWSLGFILVLFGTEDNYLLWDCDFGGQ